MNQAVKDHARLPEISLPYEHTQKSMASDACAAVK
jgi:hypothetical protein